MSAHHDDVLLDQRPPHTPVGVGNVGVAGGGGVAGRGSAVNICHGGNLVGRVGVVRMNMGGKSLTRTDSSRMTTVCVGVVNAVVVNLGVVCGGLGGANHVQQWDGRRWFARRRLRKGRKLISDI